MAVCAVLPSCVEPPADTPPQAIELVAEWDAGSCGPPHRIAIDLGDEAGAAVSRSAPCAAGTVTFELPQLGAYAGWIYAWSLAAGAGSGSGVPVSLDVDAAITRWEIEELPR